MGNDLRGYFSNNLSLCPTVCVLDDSKKKKKFCNSLISVIRKLWERENVFVEGNFIGHVGIKEKDSEVQPGDYGYSVRNEEVNLIMEFCAVMKMIIRTTLFKKRTSHPVIYVSGWSKTKLDCC